MIVNKNKSMKVILLSILFFMFVISPCVYGAGIGITVWYAQWKPAWEDEMKNPDLDGVTENYFDMNPSFMYGPTLSFDIMNQWKISTTALFGNFDYECGYTMSTGKKRVFQGEEFKWDSDVTLQYIYNRYFFFFGGIKYQGYVSETDIIILSSTNEELTRFSSKTRYYQIGPGLGVGCAVPLWGASSLLYSINFVGEYASDDNSEDKSADYWVYGINTTLGISYYAKSLRTSFFIGGKLQLFHYNGQDGTENEKSDGRNDLFYGVVFSAVYRI